MSYLTDFEKDTLKEIGGICAGRAITSLSKMLFNQMIDIDLPKFGALKSPSIIDIHPEDTYSVHFRITGDLNGCISFHFTKKEAIGLIKKTTFTNQGYSGLDEIGKDALTELGSIMGGSYVTSLSNLFKLDLMSTKFLMSSDKYEYIVALEFLGDDLINLNSVFSVFDEEVFSTVWFLLDESSARKLLDRSKALQ